MLQRLFSSTTSLFTARRFGAILLSSAIFAGSAMAQALVVVEVRGASTDGRVELRARGGDENSPTYSCQTQNGECEIDAVPGGRYVVTFTPAGGEALPPHNAMIPPEGRVELRLSGTASD